MLAALEPVDFAVIFDEDTPVELIRTLRPDVHVKGGDYRAEDLPEAEVLAAYGGQVRILDQVPEHSTRTLIERIRRGVPADGSEAQ